ncbi:hypothetical protein NYV46_24815 [Escherichia coli]|nr:hypothetical protein [Escherichia coli]
MAAARTAPRSLSCPMAAAVSGFAQGGSDGDFFLLLHDVAMGTDYQVADILASQHDCKQRRGSQLPVNLKTCPKRGS